MRVYYLTGAQFALSNLALRRIKIARFKDLNDPFELLGVDVGDKKLRAAIRETKEEINRSKGLICFSKSWHNPLMWGHYAEKHTGMCLGFDVPESLIAPVIYAKRPLKMEICPETRGPKPTGKFMRQLVRTKFFDWKYEDEMRLFVELDHDTVESGKYFPIVLRGLEASRNHPWPTVRVADRRRSEHRRRFQATCSRVEIENCLHSI